VTEQNAHDSLARLLREQGNYVITVGGVDWYDYSGFMMPAYLPHCCPRISREIAAEVARTSERPFARWDTDFGRLENSEWWYVLKKGAWRIEDVKDKKKRWMIRQGKKRFSVRQLALDEVASECSRVAQSAVARYRGEAKVETREVLDERVRAAETVPNLMEYVGCFEGSTLVSFSENYIQGNAVWLANIRHDPAFLNKYSSYGLMDGLLDYYLNQKKMDFVLDGCRSIHHRTHFQEHLMKVFGFTREYAALKVAYSPKFRMAARTAYPFKNLVWRAAGIWTNSTLDRIAAVLRQEYIRRSCEKLRPPADNAG
jgi:hypothetical protein